MNKMKVTKNFSLHEFESPDTKEVKLDEQLVEKLQVLRDKLGIPLKVNSGYRTKEYNDDLRRRGYNSSTHSQHLLGKAADVSMRNVRLPKEKVKQIAIELGFTGIGLYDTFVHLDTRSNPNPRGYSFWDYRRTK